MIIYLENLRNCMGKFYDILNLFVVIKLWKLLGKYFGFRIFEKLKSEFEIMYMFLF